MLQTKLLWLFSQWTNKNSNYHSLLIRDLWRYRVTNVKTNCLNYYFFQNDFFHSPNHLFNLCLKKFHLNRNLLKKQHFFTFISLGVPKLFLKVSNSKLFWIRYCLVISKKTDSTKLSYLQTTSKLDYKYYGYMKFTAIITKKINIIFWFHMTAEQSLTKSRE